MSAGTPLAGQMGTTFARRDGVESLAHNGKETL